MRRERELALAVLLAFGISACASHESRREQSFREAEQAAANGDLERAVEILRGARAFDPRDRLIATRLAQIYEQSHAYRLALSLVEAFPEHVADPLWRNLRARLLLRSGHIRGGGRLAMALSDRGEAEEETLQALSDIVVQRKLGSETMDELPESWIRKLAERLAEVGEIGMAASWLERLPPVYDLEQDPLARTLVEGALASDDASLVARVDNLVADAASPLKLLVHRRALVLAGRGAEVARIDAQFLSKFPDDPRRGEILESEGRRHLARGDFEQALSYADRALALGESSAGALILRGLALEWSGELEEGHRALRMALAIEPDNRVAREALRSTQTPGTLVMRIAPPNP